jgi:glycosyltransferase involved in cell wall biosynthesis
MRIGIDASRAFGSERTGTENYSYEMIMAILALPEAKEHEWILYTKHQITNSKIQTNSNVQIKKIKLLHLWTQLGLAFRTWIDRLDVLWVPAHTLPILRKPGLKTVVTIHGIEYEWLPAYENLLQRWYLPLSTMYACKQASKLIAVSNFTRSELVERLGAKDYRITTIHEGVLTQVPRNPFDKLRASKFQDTNKQKIQILKKYNLKEKEYLLFIGTVQPRKNLERLIEAFSHIGGVVKLVIVGKLGWEYDSIITAPKRFGVEDKVKLIGYVDDSDRDILLRSALIYVQPSITEGFGLPIVEAWQAKVPVVSSRGGALKEVVGEAGLLFDPLNIKDICDSLSLVINSHKLQRELISKGLKRVGEFNWKKSAIQTYNILTRWN